MAVQAISKIGAVMGKRMWQSLIGGHTGSGCA